ncbi:MAG: VOC family protein [Woeseiaceae bacterium]|nr:VOC family protein [Woeseiaceae bacterium]
MNESDNGEWPAEAGPPGSLPTEIEPPKALEDRVVRSLIDQGLIERGPVATRRGIGWRAVRASLAAAACFALVGVGVWIGRGTGDPVPTSLTGAETDLYALLLFETDGYDRPVGAEALTRYGEYSQWIAQAAARNQFVTGEDLEADHGWLLAPADGGVTVRPSPAVEGTPPLSGVLFIRADTPDEALEIARRLPHLRHGGTVIMQKTIPTDTPPPVDAAATKPVADTGGPRVTGLGGVFFKSPDPQRLYRWYEEHLGLKPTPGENHVNFCWRELDGDPARTVWGPFREDTTYFDPGTRDAMFNYRVDDLDGLLDELRAKGVAIADEIEEYPYGRFAWIIDIDGNKVELWEPDERDYPWTDVCSPS